MLTLEQFAAFVEREAVWFRGFNRESRSSLEQAERDLGQPLPATLKWLLSNFGYWRATGVGGLPFVVGTTSSFRPTFPDHWMILSRPTLKCVAPEAECGPSDRGVVVLVTSPDHLEDGRAVLVCDIHGQIWRRYSGFAPYVVALQQQLARVADMLYRDCLPSFHQQNSGVMDADEQGFDLEEFRQRLLEAMLCQQLDQQLDEPHSELPQAVEHAIVPVAEAPVAEVAAETVSIEPTVPSEELHSTATVPFPATEACDHEAIVEEVSRLLDDKPATDEVAASPVFADEAMTEEPFVALPSEERPEAGEARYEAALNAAAARAAMQAIPAQMPAFASSAESAAADSEEMLEQEVQQILLQRRKTLQQAHIAIPRECFHNSSSPNRALRLPDHLPGGRLLATSLEMVGNPLDLLGDVLEPVQHIAILQRRDGEAVSRWLISWVADSQMSLLTHHWSQITGAQPDWIMESGDVLAELPGRLQRVQEAA